MHDQAIHWLRLYDQQLRTDAETAGAVSVTRLGPLHLVTFRRGRGFVTYRDLAGVDADAMRRLVARALAHYQEDPAVGEVEWKTRSHDQAPALHDVLIEQGFVPEEPESVMMGEARTVAVDLPLPDGVSLRRVTLEADVRAMVAVQVLVFGHPAGVELADGLLRRLRADDGMELWVAEADGCVVSTGRLEPVAGTEVAGIWGGATLPAWRGRGIYRALTAARARSALRLGKTLLHSDSSAYSRPILERAGLVKLSTTTPYSWRR